MTVTFQTPGQVGPNCWKLRWTSNLEDPLYRVYVDGQNVRVGRRNWEVVTLPGAAGALVEVLDTAAVPASAGEGQVTINWAAVSGAAAYRIEEYVDGAWVRRAAVRTNGTARLTWRSVPLDDAAGHQFRVTPIGTNGNPGTPATITAAAPRHPAPPNVAFGYDDETKKVTVTAM